MTKLPTDMASISHFHPFHRFFLLLVLACSLAASAKAQTNSFPLYSSGAYSGGTGDNTNVSTPQLKLQSTSGYIRVTHLSASASISAVYNYETGKDAYWGEVADVGNYWFRGRNLLVQGGKVGINVATPQYQLDAAGQVGCNAFILTNKYPGSSTSDLSLTGYFNTSAYDMIAIHNGWDPNGLFIAGYNASNATAAVWTGLATKKVYIGTPAFNNMNYMCVNLMTGGVGIGTINTNDPNNRLFVETGIRTRKITIDQATWPDYVFSPDYRLLPLDSLRSYIVSNKHLPEMPSADSVTKNGVELGDGESRLLKKVEELTLYIIEQQKEIEEIKAENTEMATQIEILRKSKNCK